MQQMQVNLIATEGLEVALKMLGPQAFVAMGAHCGPWLCDPFTRKGSAAQVELIKPFQC